MREALTPDQIWQVVERNPAETHAGVCHSHDVCRANMVLHEVLMRHGMGTTAEDAPSAWTDLWT